LGCVVVWELWCCSQCFLHNFDDALLHPHMFTTHVEQYMFCNATCALEVAYYPCCISITACVTVNDWLLPSCHGLAAAIQGSISLESSLNITSDLHISP
jgi:hypothetical protein